MLQERENESLMQEFPLLHVSSYRWVRGKGGVRKDRRREVKKKVYISVTEGLDIWPGKVGL